MIRRYLLPLILVSYLLIALGYSVINPLFEAPDEHWHYFTAQYIAETGQLPLVAEDYDRWLSQEAAQPPLYYLLGAGLIAPVDTDDAKTEIWFNPFAWLGTANPANINLTVHTPAESWPWQGYALAAHLMRAMSVLFGLGTLLFVYGSARLLWPDDEVKALMSTALVAFLPQFAFIHGSITNDSLITLLSSAAIWQLLRIWLSHVDLKRLLLLGVTVGLAILSKNAGILLLFFAIAVLCLLAIRDRKSRLLLDVLLFVVLPVLLIAGWLWWRNWTLYADITAANQFIRLAGGDRAYSLRQVLGETSGLWLSLFAIFGWFNVRAPDWIYAIWNGMVLLAVAGTVWALGAKVKAWNGRLPALTTRPISAWLRQDWIPMALLLLWLLTVYAGLVRFMLQTQAAQGRLLFPAIISLALGLVHGTSQLKWRITSRLMPLAALITSVFCLFFVIKPTYATLPVVGDLPQEVTRLDQQMGQGLTLVGAHIESEVVRPGEEVLITLYWQADRVPGIPPEVVLELFGRELARIGHLHSYHGRGLYPANLWPEGQIIADRFAVKLNEEMEAPVYAWAQTRLAGSLPPINIGSVKVVPRKWPAAPVPVLARLGNGIELVSATLSPNSARPGDKVTINVRWRVTEAPEGDYTTLVHLGTEEEPPLATGDSSPLSGEYPSTIWNVGEVIEDSLTVTMPEDLPEGLYPVWIGMYESDSPKARLPLVIDGIRQANDVYLVNWVNIKQ